MGKAQGNPFAQEMDDPTNPLVPKRGPFQYPLPWGPSEDDATPAPPSAHLQGAGQGRTRGSAGFKFPKIGKMSWGEIWKATKDFFTHPMNIAITVWMILTTPACIIIGLDYLGMLSKLIPNKEEADKWVEISIQLVNGLYVLACIVMAPLLIRQTILLVRWHPSDKIELRRFYCKNGARKPHDRTHMSIVVFFGHLTVIANLAFSAVFWLFPVGDRPMWLVNSTFAAAWIAPAVSLCYLLLCPLSKNYDIVKEGDEQHLRMFERSTSFFVEQRMLQMGEAAWQGDVCPGCCASQRVAWCTMCLPCCMFGYNMERLGFGHRMVHTSAFMIVLVGPMLVFAASAHAMRHIGVPIFVVFCIGLGVGILGLGYGGLWRMKMRRRYSLPGAETCCWSPDLTDICTWMWCSACALCQEIRTADLYEVGERSSLKMVQQGYLDPNRASTVVVRMEADDYPSEEDAEMRRPTFSFTRSARKASMSNPLAQRMQP